MLFKAVETDELVVTTVSNPQIIAGSVYIIHFESVISVHGCGVAQIGSAQSQLQSQFVVSTIPELFDSQDGQDIYLILN